MKIISKKICMWSDKGIKFSHSINICVSCLSRSEWATKSCWMKLSHFVWWSDDIAPPWWHARWRSGGICILLKYFHSLKYFSGVENISPWQSWYKSLCYLCPTVRDIRCWYICCFSFQSPHWFVCLFSVLLKRNICGNSRGGQNRELFDLTTNTIEFLRKRVKWCQLWSNLLHIISSRQSSAFLEI